MKKMLSTIVLGLTVLAAVSLTTGCSMFESDDSDSGSSSEILTALSTVVDGAVDVAAQVLADEGTQAMAIAAIQSYVNANVDDEEQAAMINQAVESMVPAIANAVATLADDDDSSDKNGLKGKALLDEIKAKIKNDLKEKLGIK